MHHDVAEDDELFAFGLDEYARMPRCVAGRRDKAHAGHNFELAVDENHQAGVAQRLDAVARGADVAASESSDMKYDHSSPDTT